MNNRNISTITLTQISDAIDTCMQSKNSACFSCFRNTDPVINQLQDIVKANDGDTIQPATILALLTLIYNSPSARRDVKIVFNKILETIDPKIITAVNSAMPLLAGNSQTLKAIFPLAWNNPDSATDILVAHASLSLLLTHAVRIGVYIPNIQNLSNKIVNDVQLAVDVHHALHNDLPLFTNVAGNFQKILGLLDPVISTLPNSQLAKSRTMPVLFRQAGKSSSAGDNNPAAAALRT